MTASDVVLESMNTSAQSVVTTGSFTDIRDLPTTDISASRF